MEKTDTMTKEQWEALPRTWGEIVAIEPMIGELLKKFKRELKETGDEDGWSLYIEYRSPEIYHPGVKGIDDLVGMFAPEGSRLYHPDGVTCPVKQITPYDVVTDRFMKAIGHA